MFRRPLIGWPQRGLGVRQPRVPGEGKSHWCFYEAPRRYDHGVRERQFGEGQDPAQYARDDQFVDLGVHVLDARVRQDDRSRR
jgi:hypothetical protein